MINYKKGNTYVVMQRSIKRKTIVNHYKLMINELFFCLKLKKKTKQTKP